MAQDFAELGFFGGWTAAWEMSSKNSGKIKKNVKKNIFLITKFGHSGWVPKTPKHETLILEQGNPEALSLIRIRFS